MINPNASTVAHLLIVQCTKRRVFPCRRIHYNRLPMLSLHSWGHLWRFLMWSIRVPVSSTRYTIHFVFLNDTTFTARSETAIPLSQTQIIWLCLASRESWRVLGLGWLLGVGTVRSTQENIFYGLMLKSSFLATMFVFQLATRVAIILILINA